MPGKTAFSLSVLFMVFAAWGAASQEVPRLYRLAEVRYEKVGLVQDFALASLLGVEIGSEYRGSEELERFIGKADLALRGERMFEAGSGVGWEPIGQPGPDGLQDFRLIVRVSLSGTALAFPYPKYSRSDGASLAVRYKDYNFLGTLEPLTLSFDAFAKGAIDLGAKFSLPVQRGVNTYTLSLDGSLAADGQGLTLDGSTGLSASIPLLGLGPDWFLLPSLSYGYSRDDRIHTTRFGAAIQRNFSLPIAWSLSYSESGSLQYSEGWASWLSHSLSASTSLYLFDAGAFGPATLSLSTGPGLENDLPGLGLRDLSWSLSSSLGADSVVWEGNQRTGASFSLGSVQTWYLDPGSSGAGDQVSIDFESTWFRPLSDLVGLNLKAEGHWFPSWTFEGQSSDFAWEDLFRGRSGSMRGDAGFAASIELPLNFAQGRFFDAELLSAEVFLDPFLDLGFVRSDPAQALLASGQGVACGGLEVVVYPDKARAFAYRVSAGYDLGDLLATRSLAFSKLELWLGLGLFF